MNMAFIAWGRMKKDFFSSDPVTAGLATGYAGLRPLRNHGSVAFSCLSSYS
jgi:hypothetical protein